MCVRFIVELYTCAYLIASDPSPVLIPKDTNSARGLRRGKDSLRDHQTILSMLLLLPLLLPSWQHPSANLHERRSLQRTAPPLSRRHALSAAAAVALGVLPGQNVRPASAAYGDFAKMGTDAGTQGVLAAGDPNNECLFATPGTGLCQVPPPPPPPPPALLVPHHRHLTSTLPSTAISVPVANPTIVTSFSSTPSSPGVQVVGAGALGLTQPSRRQGEAAQG